MLDGYFEDEDAELTEADMAECAEWYSRLVDDAHAEIAGAVITDDDATPEHVRELGAEAAVAVLNAATPCEGGNGIVSYEPDVIERARRAAEFAMRRPRSVTSRHRRLALRRVRRRARARRTRRGTSSRESPGRPSDDGEIARPRPALRRAAGVATHPFVRARPRAHGASQARPGSFYASHPRDTA